MKNHCDAKRFGKEANGVTEAQKAKLLEAFIQKSKGKAYEFAYKLAGNSEEAKELVQEALYRVLRNWTRYDAAKPLETWFFTILRNAFFDSRKRFDRRNILSLDAPAGEDDGGCLGWLLADESESIPASLERAEIVAEVQKEVKGLNKNLRSVLWSSNWDGLQYGEIARTLGIPQGTVRSRICRAKQSLRSQAPQLEALAY